jgi:hypothetical protein
MVSRVRRRDTRLAAYCILGSFCLTLTIGAAVRHAADGHSAAGDPRPARIDTGLASPWSPTSLDGQWLTYSDGSSCADRAGGDGVSAVRLNSKQVAWFFSDSWLGPAGPRIGFSRNSGFLHNLIVVQTTAGQHSQFVTITGGDGCDGPGQTGSAVSVVSSHSAGGAGDRYWAGAGILAGQTVLTFYTGYQQGGPPYIPTRTVLAGFPAATLSREGSGPAYGESVRPHLTLVPSYVPPSGGSMIVWGASLLRLGPTVYIYGWQLPDPATGLLTLYLARAPVARLADLAAWRYYAGPGQWAGSQASAAPLPAGDPPLAADTDFSVVPAAGRFWLIEQAGEIGSPDIDAFPAAKPWGPFDASAGVVLYRAPGIGMDAADNYQFIYGVNAEPGLSNKRTLLLSYSVNSEAVTAGCTALSNYTNLVVQPRFIGVPRAVFPAAEAAARGHDGPAAGGLVDASRSAVAAGQAGYPSIVRTDPSQWFDAWAYPSHCPPVPAVSGLSAVAVTGGARLSWQSSGLGVRYSVYIDGPDGYVLWRKVRATRVTLSDLASGYRQVLVVPSNNRGTAGPGASITVTIP